MEGVRADPAVPDVPPIPDRSKNRSANRNRTKRDEVERQAEEQALAKVGRMGTKISQTETELV